MGTGVANALGVQWGQMTPAQQVLGQLMNGSRKGRTSTRRRKKKAAAKSTRRRKTARRASGRKRLVKGSAAAKRHMARLRRMRKRR